ncbi:hypothetical protein ABZY83_08245 [Streptomyces virginiae]|uniref:hypothetical protein n=1 Tax=Streptomyces TaxID=1883 RepID=UPI0006AEF39D|nr:hypothetical protein [Streptomyces sp. H021]
MSTPEAAFEATCEAAPATAAPDGTGAFRPGVTGPAVAWSVPFCSEGANCFRFGRDTAGRTYIGTTGSAAFVTDSVDALRALVAAVNAGEADHLLA